MMVFIAFYALLFIFNPASADECPTMYGCKCGINLLPPKIGSTVLCDAGNLQFIPVQHIPADVRHLIITNPPHRPNRFRLKVGLFRKFTQLEELHLTGSTSLHSIGEDTFFELSPTLKLLNLSHNSLEYLIENNFRRLSKLTHLYLDNNYITGLNSATFSMLSSMELLSLSSNYIRELPFAFSVGLSRLRTLVLSNNPLGTSRVPDPQIGGGIPDSAFNGTYNLKELLLSNTSLQVLPFDAMSVHMPQLQVLDVSSAHICNVEAGQFDQMKNLIDLRMSNMVEKCNRLNFEDYAFAGFSNLQALDLSGNKIEGLKNLVSRLKRLQWLDLSGNRLYGFSANDVYSSARSLKHLDLSGNRGVKIDGNLLKLLSVLESFGVSGTVVPSSRNQLEGLLAYGRRLKKVEIARNELTGISGTVLQSLVETEILDLSENNLTEVPEGLEYMPQLVHVNLTYNFIESFSDNTLQHLVKVIHLRKVLLHGNTLHCECEMFPLYNWLRGTAGREMFCTGANNEVCPACYSPAEFYAVPLNRMEPSAFGNCRYLDDPLIDLVSSSPLSRSSIAIIIVVSCVLALVACFVLTIWCMKARRHSYYTHEEKRDDADESLYADPHLGDISWM